MIRKPWENGAKAYPQADTIDDVVEYAKRKRNPFTIHLSHVSCGNDPCAACGYPLAGEYPLNPGEPKMVKDTTGYAYCDVNPRKKTYAVRHYYCAWGHTMNLIHQLGRQL